MMMKHDENKNEDKDGNQDEIIGLHVASQTINNLPLQDVEIDKKTDVFVAVSVDGNFKNVHDKPNTGDEQDAPNGQNAQDSGVKSSLDSDNEQEREQGRQDSLQWRGFKINYNSSACTIRNDSININNIAANSIWLGRNFKKSSNENSSHNGNNSNTNS